MQLPRLALSLILMFCSPDIAAEDWIGLEAPNPSLLGLDLGTDDDGGETQSLSALVPLGDHFGYVGAYSVTELDDGVQTFDNYALATTVWLEVSELMDFELHHFFEGNDDELEKETLGMAIFLRRENWHFRVQLDAGDLLIFTSDDISDLFRRVPGRIESDVDAWEVAIGWQAETWYGQASYREFDYSRDLTVLEKSDFAQFVVKSSALAHSSVLVLDIAILRIGHANFDNDYSLSLSQERSAIDRAYYDTLTLGWEHWAGAQWGFSLAWSVPSEADNIGMLLGLRWVL